MPPEQYKRACTAVADAYMFVKPNGRQSDAESSSRPMPSGFSFGMLFSVQVDVTRRGVTLGDETARAEKKPLDAISVFTAFQLGEQ